MKMWQLRQWFAAEVDAQYYRWRHKCKPGHKGARYRQMITKYGHVRAAKKLLKSKSPGAATGTGIEHLVVTASFAPLFTKEEIKIAWHRIYAVA